jgi:hypothetical protein
MPLKNAFGTPSCGRASAILRSGKLRVSWGQQPKPQIVLILFFLHLAWMNLFDEAGFTAFTGNCQAISRLQKLFPFF